MATVTLLRHVAILASCVIMVVTSLSEPKKPVIAPPEPAPAAVQGSQVKAPAGQEENGQEKRSNGYCVVDGRYYSHGQIFTLPDYSHCLKYRCSNGGYHIAQDACERNGQCIPVGSTTQDGCRSMRCVKENRGNMNTYYMAPTHNDKCEANGSCYRKNVPFDIQCQSFRCVDTGYGGYRFEPMGRTSTKCQDLRGNCVEVGARFAQWVNGNYYTNCICQRGGGYTCRG